MYVYISEQLNLCKAAQNCKKCMKGSFNIDTNVSKHTILYCIIIYIRSISVQITIEVEVPKLFI